MPKPGNWGDWAIIDLPPLEVKKVSCYACVNYIEEDGSCSKTAHIPRIDGKHKWRTCKEFRLSPEYMNYSFKKEVLKMRGAHFFENEAGVTEKKKVQDEIVNEEIKVEVPLVVEDTENTDEIRTKVICEPRGKRPNRIQFNVKSAKGFRILLAKYFNARQFDSQKIKEQLVEKEYSDEFVKSCLQWSREESNERIKEALNIVPDNLANAFISVDPEEFPVELAVFFYTNGLEKATNQNCKPYCEAIRGFALDYLLGSKKHVGLLPIEPNAKKKMLLLDAIATIFVDAGIISDDKYKMEVDYIARKVEYLYFKN